VVINGNLLYDNPNNPRQNLVAENILPLTVSDISIINSDKTVDINLSQTAKSPVNIGDKVTYTVTAKKYRVTRCYRYNDK